MAKKNRKQVIKPVEDSPSYDDKVEATEEEHHGDETLKTPPSVAISESETENQVSTVDVVKTKKNKVRASVEEKKMKRLSVETSTEEKPKVCQRIFTDDDEIRVLQGVIDFESKFGKRPYEDKAGIYKFVKRSISFEVASDQLLEKIRTLRRKFMGQVEKKGFKPVFAKAHDQKTFDLSMSIWRRDVVESAAAKSRKTTKRKVKEEDGDVLVIDSDQDWFQKSYLVGSIANLGIGEKSVKERWNLVPKKKKQKLEEKWRALQLDGLRFMLRKTELVHEVTSAIAEAMTF